MGTPSVNLSAGILFWLFIGMSGSGHHRSPGPVRMGQGWGTDMAATEPGTSWIVEFLKDQEKKLPAAKKSGQ